MHSTYVVSLTLILLSSILTKCKSQHLRKKKTLRHELAQRNVAPIDENRVSNAEPKDEDKLITERSRLTHLISSCILFIRVTDYGDEQEGMELDCKLSDEYEGSIVHINNVPNWLTKEVSEGKILSGIDILTCSECFASVDNGVLHITDDAEVSVERAPETGGRSLMEANRSGNMKVLAIHVTASDVKNSVSMATNDRNSLTDYVFGTYSGDVSVQSQFAACSNGRLNLSPFNGLSSSKQVQVKNGVYEVYIPKTVTGMVNTVLEKEVLKKAEQRLGVLKDQFDLVMLCLPPGTEHGNGGGWRAYGRYNDNVSVYNNDSCRYLSAMMHEIGHNLFGFRHSDEKEPRRDRQSYGDSSGLMGLSYAEERKPLMCYNAVKNWELDWFNRQKVIITEDEEYDGEIFGAYSPAIGNQNDQTMIVKILLTNNGGENYYISYNRNTGPNLDTKEAANRVLVHMETGLTKSALVARLTKGGSYDIEIHGEVIKISVVQLEPNANSAFISVKKIEAGEMTCADSLSNGLPWHHHFGDIYNCAWFAEGNRCSSYGVHKNSDSSNANKMCCACGGGDLVAGGIEPDEPACINGDGWKDATGDTCTYYKINQNACKSFGDSYADAKGFTANEKCCVCQ